jgi:uncharacterized protein (DUF1697 family)
MPVGKNSCPMAKLNETLSSNGYENARTWIQSGNIALKANESADIVATKIHSLIKDNIGADLPVIIKTHDEVKLILDKNPFCDKPHMERMLLSFYNDTPSEDIRNELNNGSYLPDEFYISSYCAYMYIPRKYNDSKLSNSFLERKLKIKTTTRNYSTVYKMLKISRNEE